MRLRKIFNKKCKVCTLKIALLKEIKALHKWRDIYVHALQDSILLIW